MTFAPHADSNRAAQMSAAEVAIRRELWGKDKPLKNGDPRKNQRLTKSNHSPL